MRDWGRFWSSLAQRRALPRSPWPAPQPAAPVGLGLPDEELLARRLAALGFKDLAGIRVTDNRTVMVSLSRRRVLSIHRGYAQAPDRVLRAVVRFFARSTPRALRRAAQHEILSFGAESHAPGPPRRRRAADRPRPGDLATIERLAQLFRQANAQHFGGALPDLPIRLSGRMKTRLGQLCLEPGSGAPCEITVSRRHLARHGWTEVADTLLHEMVHLWQHASGHPVDHGRLFRAKTRELGVTPAARRSVRRPVTQRRAARVD